MTNSASWRTPTVVLICGSAILTLGMGLRHGFGLFLQPVSADMHWHRETFALALAMQNLVWGATQPFAGMLADKYGSGRVVLGGAILYVLGLFWMAHPTSQLAFVMAAGVLIGTGLSGVTFSVIAGVLGRAYPPEKRSMVLGISAAAGSFGQFALVPITQLLLSQFGWVGALMALGGVGVLMWPLAAGLVERRAHLIVPPLAGAGGVAVAEAGQPAVGGEGGDRAEAGPPDVGADVAPAGLQQLLAVAHRLAVDGDHVVQPPQQVVRLPRNEPHT
jgi:MFS family permease